MTCPRGPYGGFARKPTSPHCAFASLPGSTIRPDGEFDAVVSSLFFHHLLRPGKRAALAEIARVIRPGGRLLIADWGRPANPAYRALFLAVQLLDGFATTRDSVEGALPSLMGEAGLEAPRIVREFGTAVGTLAIYSGSKLAAFTPELSK